MSDFLEPCGFEDLDLAGFELNDIGMLDFPVFDGQGEEHVPELELDFDLDEILQNMKSMEDGSGGSPQSAAMFEFGGRASAEETSPQLHLRRILKHDKPANAELKAALMADTPVCEGCRTPDCGYIRARVAEIFGRHQTAATILDAELKFADLRGNKKKYTMKDLAYDMRNEYLSFVQL